MRYTFLVAIFGDIKVVVTLGGTAQPLCGLLRITPAHTMLKSPLGALAPTGPKSTQLIHKH
jgi:hypothetical protein